MPMVHRRYPEVFLSHSGAPNILLLGFFGAQMPDCHFILFASGWLYDVRIHTITYRASPVGKSWNALGSCLIFCLHDVIEPKRCGCDSSCPLLVVAAISHERNCKP